MSIRVRFPPSPTGRLHIGGARTALFNYLFAKKQGGVFVLRIEDTDRERSRKEFEKDIVESMAWLGIRADEGLAGYAEMPMGGSFGPYRQSERSKTYRRYLERLAEQGTIFVCSHGPAELEAERKARTEKKEPPVHWCGEKKGIGDLGPGSALRFHAPEETHISFRDEIRGEIEFSTDQIGDFVIAKNLDTPLYNFAAAVDDAAMEISHVIRGEEHIANTPKQMLVLEALGFEPPKYAHVPLILAADRSKLSKREGATAVREFRDDGYLPKAIVNFIAFLGWNPGHEKEFYSLDELAEEFDLARIQKSGAIWDAEKLDWFNGIYIRKESPAGLARLAMPFIESAIPEAKDADAGFIECVAALEQPRLKRLAELPDKIRYFFRDPKYGARLLFWKQMAKEEVEKSLQFSKEILESLPAEKEFSPQRLERAFLSAIGSGDKGAILWPLRVALTGEKASPSPFEIASVLGKAKSVDRIENARAILRATGEKEA